jgi:hypothetical protein
MTDIPEKAFREALAAYTCAYHAGASPEDRVRATLGALTEAGMAVVSAEDLDDATDALCEREDVCFGEDCSNVHCQRVNRLRAALPERTDHA